VCECEFPASSFAFNSRQKTALTSRLKQGNIWAVSENWIYV